MFINLARVSDLNVTKNKAALEANTPTHDRGNNAAARVLPPWPHKEALRNSSPGLGGKITKPIRNQKQGERLGRGIRRTSAKTIGNIAQGKVPGRGSGGKTSEFVSRWSIDSVDINSLLR